MDWVNEYIRLEFKELGRSVEGVDCWGLIKLIYQDRLGIEIPSLLEYSNTKDMEEIPRLVRENAPEWVKVEQGEEKQYDVVIFQMCSVPMHVGLVIGRNLMIHCERGSGTVVTNYKKNKQWNRRVVGFYRHAEHSNLTHAVRSDNGSN